MLLRIGPIFALMGIISIAIVMLVITASSLNKNGNLQMIEGNSSCVTSSELTSQPFFVKKPASTALPSDYKLSAIRSTDNQVSMYYSKKVLCPFPKSFLAQVPPDTIIIKASQKESKMSSEEFVYVGIEEKRDSYPDLKKLDLNGRLGYGWESFITDFQSNNSDASATRIPAGIEFYDEEFDTIYSLQGWQSLKELKVIAESIQ